MSIVLRIVLAIVSIVFLGVIVHLIAKNKLLLKFSFFWLILGVLGLICAIFPELVYAVAGWIGFLSPANFVFFFCMLVVLGISLMLTMVISKQSRYIRRLVQQLSILESETGDLESRQ